MTQQALCPLCRTDHSVELDEKGVEYVVRLWDGFDGLWMDVNEDASDLGTHPLSHEEAYQLWLKMTNNGTEKTSFSDIDYYSIFPADTTMRFSYESRRSMRDGEF